MTYREIYIARHCSPNASLEAMRSRPLYVANDQAQARIPTNPIGFVGILLPRPK